MKKLLLALAFVFCAASVSAQGWGLGARVNAGVQLQAEYTFSSENYLDGRVGINFPGGLDLDLTLLYQWNIGQWDWTPKAGSWFVDLGVGANVGMASKYLYVGGIGCAKLGIKFNKTPVKLALDYSPSIGPWIGGKSDASAADGTKTHVGIRTEGFFNFGISCVYCF
jgi:hypothetical protein